MAREYVNTAKSKDSLGLHDKAIGEVAALASELKAQFAALTAKLDADTGVTDTDYNTLNPAAASPTSLADQYFEA